MNSGSFAMGFAAGDSRDETINELTKAGTLLPAYDWTNEEFYNKMEAIVADWYKRHPETTRESGEFEELYPEKRAAVTTLENMTGKGRITPEEYIILFKEIYNF